jgi:ankyrin repeat protein
MYSESILHKASRSADLEVFEFIITHGGDVNAVDDYGRTSLHDVCWRAEPRFDIVTLILDRNINLLRTLDKRGFSPLRYIRQEHWLHWCAYFFHQKDKYWPIKA